MNRKARRAAARRHANEKMTPPADVVQPAGETAAPGTFAAVLERVAQEILAVTYWFDPEPRSEPYTVTIRFSGRRLNVNGRASAGDRFVQDETIQQVIPGSGPISVTVRVRGINPGEWTVTAHPLQSSRPANGTKAPAHYMSEAGRLPFGVRLWQRWAPSVEPAESMHTCLLPFAHVPGIFTGLWGLIVVLGIVIALLLQFLVMTAKHLALGPALPISLVAILVGVIGAKAWYLVTYRRERLRNGWCIQGFITGATLTAAIMLLAFNVPAGAFLDATAPGLLLAMAVGRVGCFFAGCCGGPPTASRFGVWSSDQRVGARRVPTQLLELTLAGVLGIGTLVAALSHGPANGAFFVGGLAAYTLVRQGILRLRAEPRKTRWGSAVMVVLAVLILILAVILFVR